MNTPGGFSCFTISPSAPSAAAAAAAPCSAAPSIGLRALKPTGPALKTAAGGAFFLSCREDCSGAVASSACSSHLTNEGQIRRQSKAITRG